VDVGGQTWIPVDSKARRSSAYGPSWTPMDAAWRSTDQKVGGSSPSGRAAEVLSPQGLVLDRRPVPSDAWEPFGGGLGDAAR